MIFLQIRSNPRAAAVEALVKIEQAVFIQDAINQVFGQFQLSRLDTALATEIIYGTVRMQLNLDYYLDHISHIDMANLSARVRNILRSGAYQILYLDRVPVSAAVNESVNLIAEKKRQKIGGFVNAVLRNLVRKHKKIFFPKLESDPIDYISYKYSHPDWMVSRWIKRYGIDNTIELCRINNTVPQTDLRVNTLKITVKQLQSYLCCKKINTKAARFAPDILTTSQTGQLLLDRGFLNGYYYLQNESSALVAHAVGPRSGDLVYDLCAAPGGKATHLAQLMKNKGKIIAVDQTNDRVELILENAKRLDISIIETLVGDAARIQLPQADKVLVDAPCSGLGVLRHKPDGKWYKLEQRLVNLAKMQKAILSNAASLVKPGGTLVYSTCTIEPEENVDVISWFLHEFSNFRLTALPKWFPGLNQRGISTILPFVHKIDGFFICKIEKFGSSAGK